MNYFLLSIAIIVVVAVWFFIIRKTTASPPSAEAKRLDDQRFAQLLITELKLYNRKAVDAGRASGDLYRRLRSEIDRSRQMYDKSVGARSSEHADYFHEELVNDLAGGDVSNLGTDYPHLTRTV